MRRRWGGLAGLPLLIALPAWVPTWSQDPSSPPVLGGLRSLGLPDELSAAADVRWQADGGLLLGLAHDGVYSWQFGGSSVELQATLSGTTQGRAARYGNYSRLGGGTTDALVFAGDLFGVYVQRGGRTTAIKKNLEIVGDVDQRDGLVVAVGLARQPEPSPGPDDIWEPYIAWLVGAEGDARGLLPTLDGGIALEACHVVELAVSRFVADDLVLVIPGAEPGAFLYGLDGSLRQTVDGDALSATRPDCGPEQRSLLRNEDARNAWLRRHRLIDDVVANHEGDIFFFVRHVMDREPSPETAPDGALEVTTNLWADTESESSSVPKANVCWDIIHARVDDLRPVATAPCAVRSGRADARLRVDLAGDRAVLLNRGVTRLGSRDAGRPAAAFEARLRAGD